MQRLRRGALIALALVALTLFLGTRSFVLRRLIEPKLASLLGCEVVCRRASFDLSGDLVIGGLTLRARGEPGDAAVFFQAPGAVVDISWLALFSGRQLAARSLVVKSPIFRISIGSDKRVNFAGVGAPGAKPAKKGGASGLALSAPRIDVTDATIEFGENDSAGRFTRLTSLLVDGSMQPTSRANVFAVALHERKEGEERAVEGRASAADKLLSVAGEINLAALEGELTLRDLDLSRWGADAAPSGARDLLRELMIDGRVKEGRFSFTNAHGLVADLHVQDVNVELPVPLDTDDFVTSDLSALRTLRTRHVTGDIRIDSAGLHVDLAGAVEDLPGRVVLNTQGLALSAPLTCAITIDDYAMGATQGLLPFAPRHVRKTFENFSNPRGNLTGVVTLSRSEPTDEGVAAPIVVEGRLQLHDGWAMRSSFPYPVRDLTGIIIIDKEKIELRDLQGVGPTGADVHVNGVISPLGRWAGVDVLVTADNTPIDDALVSALHPKMRRAVRGLLDEASYRDLERDHVFPPGAGFKLGGEGTLRVHVTRKPSLGERYHTRVEAFFPRVGLLSKTFPYPFVAHDLSLNIDGAEVTLASDHLDGVGGGVGTLRAHVITRDETGAIFKPTIDIALRGAPIDEPLLRALPPRGVSAHADLDDLPTDATSGAAWSAERIVRVLGLAGAIDVNLHVEPDTDGRIGYAADVAFDGLQSSPHGATGDGDSAFDAAPVTELRGRLRVTRKGLTMQGVQGAIAGAPMRVDASAVFPGKGDRKRSLQAIVTVTGAPLTAPFAGWAALASSKAAVRTLAAQRDHKLRGAADLTVKLDQAGDAKLASVVSLTSLRDASLDMFGGPITAKTLAGSLRLASDGVHFYGLNGDVAFDGQAFGAVTLDGVATADALTKGDFTSAASDLHVQAKQSELASSLVRSVLGRIGSGAATGVLDVFKPSGLFDADLLLGASGARGWIAPTSLTIHRNGQQVSFTDVEGRFVLADGASRIEQGQLVTDNWRLAFSGTLTRDGAQGTALEGELDLEGSRLDDDLLALLPAPVAGALRDMALQITGSFKVDNATLSIPVADPSSTAFAATLSFDGASAVIGAPIENARGVAILNRRAPTSKAGARAEASNVTLSMNLELERFRFAGVQMEGGRASLTRDGKGVIRLRDATASAHRGRVSAEATITPAMQAAGESAPRDLLYEASVRLQDVDMALALADWGEQTDALSEKPGSRGRLRGGVFVAGSLESPHAKFGRGEVEVRGGEILRLPLLMPIIELSNLSAPNGEPLEEARAAFFITGDEVQFDRIEAESNSVLVVGSGTAHWPDLALDLRFNTRRKHRLGLLSDLLEGVRDEIATATVQGTLRDPKFGMEQLPATRRLLDDLFGRSRRGREHERDTPIPQTSSAEEPSGTP